MLTEDDEQIELVKHLKLHGIMHYHVANQRRCKIQYAIKLSKMGVSKGVPDLCIPIPHGIYHGLYIELKSTNKRAKASPEQLQWLMDLNKNGYKACVCHGAHEAIKVIT